MRKCVLTACLLALTLAGCATPQKQFLPPDTDHDELMAAIAAKGQDTSGDGIPPTPESSTAANWVSGTATVAECAAYIGGYLLFAVAKAGSNHPW
jgi:hypothetical protein